ncbi:hypothetical protein [Helicobacter pylori]|nr:hypothetical protein [Helicobacter pylori]
MEEKNFLTDSAEKISINLTDFKKLHFPFSCLLESKSSAFSI